MAQDTSVEGAQLEMEGVPAAGLCRDCETESRLERFPLQCRECEGFDLEVLRGEELFVEFLELEEEPTKDKKLTADG